MRWNLPSLGHQPNARHEATPAAEPLALEWLTLAGLLVFATWLLGVRGVWSLLLSADPTGITLVIIVVFFGATLWCGARARALQAQRRALARGDGWGGDYLRALRAAPRDGGAPMDLLLEQTHGPHGTAWWFGAAAIKLGLLGTVVGFIVMATQIGRMPSFDLDQVQNLLKQMTAGMAIALYTTLVGLIGNLLLGLQLLLLDRLADRIAADVLADSVTAGRH